MLELKAVNATKVVIQGNRGAIWGQVDKGSVRVFDPNPDDNLSAFVSGAEVGDRLAGRPGRDDLQRQEHPLQVQRGQVHFSIIGTGIDVTAVGVGKRVADRSRLARRR